VVGEKGQQSRRAVVGRGGTLVGSCEKGVGEGDAGGRVLPERQRRQRPRRTGLPSSGEDREARTVEGRHVAAHSCTTLWHS